MKIFFTAKDAKDFLFHNTGEADFMKASAACGG
jgi:hypothetical protein